MKLDGSNEMVVMELQKYGGFVADGGGGGGQIGKRAALFIGNRPRNSTI